MKKINVLLLIDKFDYHGSSINGPTRNYSWLVKRINKNKFNVHLYALRKRGQSLNIFKEEGIEVQYLGLSRFNPFTLHTVMRLLIKHKIDVIQLQGYGSLVFGQLAATIFRKPTIIKEEWVDPNIWLFHGYLEGLLGKGAKKVIAISNYAKKYLIEKKNISESKIELIPNGIPLDLFYKANEIVGDEVRKSIGINLHDKAIGIVGMLHENKGHKIFLEAASIVVRRIPNSKFIVIGDGEMRLELINYVNELGIDDHVLFLGQRNDMPNIYRMLDIYVLASFSETWPTSLMEAMAAGNAIITTDCGGGSEIIEDGVNGIVIPVNNAASMAYSIEDLIQDEKKANLIRRNAMRDSSRFDVNQTVKAFENVYMSCLK